jgi:hypothetical protein
MTFPDGAWVLEQTHPVLTLTTEVKGRPFTLTAPIDSADVTVADDVTLTLGVAIDKVSAGNFLLDAALRGFLVNYGAHELYFAGTGAWVADHVELGGLAKAGQVTVDMTLELREVSRSANSLVVDVTGTAIFKDVDVPIPGIGSLDQLALAVHAQLDLIPSQ